MHADDLERRAAGVGLLADPVRRDLYRYVVDQPAPVSREQASVGVGVAHHVAKFHLDRLVEAGLLETEFRRPPGRSGPGAGRPTKLYRRAAAEVAVSLPLRRYDLAGSLMAEAIDSAAATGTPVLTALHDVAAARGAELAAMVANAVVPDGAPDGSTGTALAGSVDAAVEGRSDADPDVDPEEPDSVVTAACAALTDLGYEPLLADGEITLRSCPFHALVAEHTSLVCGLNLALLEGFVDVGAPGQLSARLDPAEGRCCVVLSVRS
ncbi:MAG: helix-turn-helix transcriptional regulator [Cellulomonas sp.]